MSENTETAMALYTEAMSCRMPCTLQFSDESLVSGSRQDSDAFSPSALPSASCGTGCSLIQSQMRGTKCFASLCPSESLNGVFTAQNKLKGSSSWYSAFPDRP
jgi:hypothetical protein